MLCPLSATLVLSLLTRCCLQPRVEVMADITQLCVYIMWLYTYLIALLLSGFASAPTPFRVVAEAGRNMQINMVGVTLALLLVVWRLSAASRSCPIQRLSGHLTLKCCHTLVV